MPPALPKFTVLPFHAMAIPVIFFFIILLQYSYRDEGNQQRYWCVVLSGVPDNVLQQALDTGCVSGLVDCEPIQPDRECYNPNTLWSHTSYMLSSILHWNGSGSSCTSWSITSLTATKVTDFDACLFPWTVLSVASKEEQGNGRINYTKIGVLVLFVALFLQVVHAAPEVFLWSTLLSI